MLEGPRDEHIISSFGVNFLPDIFGHARNGRAPRVEKTKATTKQDKEDGVSVRRLGK